MPQDAFVEHIGGVHDTEFVDGGYHSLADALAELQMKGWEPFSAHRYEDLTGEVKGLMVRNYIWFRREFTRTAAQIKRG